ncbi:alpha/beta hydrolase [Clostridium estertheticum]|uniref:alpha/beta fold hydrolase n=1 Tax=Clostridium estertheticum TaxID=238834 RepID=UPI001C6E1B5F|nr:alpha/beta hydrolase [Clostridium estertheticum]MBW9172770.1 alpha/beta hydrolase [Clostridium estertheticum]WLC77699.1 alpha/beta hydrolase [Clostridium estertheticum]
MIILKIIVTAVAVCMLIGSILHATYFKRKLVGIKPYGQLIDVDDGQMHVYSMGNGDKIIVLLPGMGTVLPSFDFTPLMRRLSEKYTVVCVEYFGVGFSSETSKPRTCENYVEETRTALSNAGFKSPYVLMPHSISSIYSEYYAVKYPQEVEAVISLDGTSSAYYEKMPSIVKHILKISKFQQAIGITSILALLITNKKDLISKGFTQTEINDAIVFGGFTINDTVLEQMANSSEFVKETMELPFPKSVPYFKIISQKTYETPNKHLRMTPQEYQHKHLERIGEHAKYEILDGNHFVYLNNVNRIAEITDGLLLKANQ